MGLPMGLRYAPDRTADTGPMALRTADEIAIQVRWSAGTGPMGLSVLVTGIDMSMGL
jgi:hypothetical protein